MRAIYIQSVINVQGIAVYENLKRQFAIWSKVVLITNTGLEGSTVIYLDGCTTVLVVSCSLGWVNHFINRKILNFKNL